MGDRDAPITDFYRLIAQAKKLLQRSCKESASLPRLVVKPISISTLIQVLARFLSL
jgi:hypothetical protein